MKQPFQLSRRLRYKPSKHGHQVLIRLRRPNKTDIEIPVRDYVGQSYVTLSVKKEHWKKGFISGGKYHKPTRDLNTLLQLVEYDVSDAVNTLLSENVKITYENVLCLTYAHKEQDIINEERIKKGELIVDEDGGAFWNEGHFIEFLEQSEDPKFIDLKKKAGLLRKQYLMDYWDDFMKNHAPDSYYTAKSALKEYIERTGDNCYAKDFDDKWVERFFNEIVKTGYKKKEKGEIVTKHYELSTIGKYFKIVRSFGDYLFDEHVLDNQKYRRFELRKDKKKQSLIKYEAEPFKNTHALYKSEFDYLFQFEFEDDNLAKIRDMFVLQTWLGGLRKSDFFSLSDANFSKDGKGNLQVWFGQKKTNENVLNPANKNYLTPIFKKYNDKLPEFPHPNKYNKLLKEAFRVAGLNKKLPFQKEYANEKEPTTEWYPMCDKISNRWARNCAVSILCELGFSDKHIMKFTGHRDEKMLKHYQQVHKKDVREMLDEVKPEKVEELP